MDLFERAAPAMEDIGSPRAWAYAALGAHEYLGGSPGLIAEELQIEMAHRLLDRYRACSREGWRWFEEIVSYANARLSQALILSGSDLGNEDMTNAGLESLRWLMEVQTTLEGRFSPIGSNGFYTSDGRRASFDQQPIEAWSSTSACISAAMVTGEQAWLSLANSSFKWFLGENDLGIQVYDPSTGGCRDGLHEDRPNENQGAESTLSFLCALSEMNQASPMKLTTPGANESTLTAVSLTPPSQNLSTLL
jgi:hypothetical protein